MCTADNILGRVQVFYGLPVPGLISMALFFPIFASFLQKYCGLGFSPSLGIRVPRNCFWDPRNIMRTRDTPYFFGPR